MRVKLLRDFASCRPMICAARMPAFVAPGFPIATVATGIPAGICTIASRESSPSSAVDGIGTAMTGSVVSAAMTPASARPRRRLR